MEVTMEATLTGPILYLLIVLGIVTAIFLALLLWRSILTTHEDDQLCIDAASEHMAQEQRELIAKITRLSKPIATSGIAAGALLLLIVGMWLYQGLKSF
jgi:predicted RND superfamily exporter protein